MASLRAPPYPPADPPCHSPTTLLETALHPCPSQLRAYRVAGGGAAPGALHSSPRLSLLGATGSPVVGSRITGRETGREKSNRSSNGPLRRSNEVSLMRSARSQWSSMRRKIDV